MSKRKWIFVIGLLVTVILIGNLAGGQPGIVKAASDVVQTNQDDDDEQPVHPYIGNAELLTLSSSIMERDYSIYVWLPRDYDEEQSYPVVYVLDGDWHTLIAWSIADLLALDYKMPQVIVVGIGYGTDDLYKISEWRQRDFGSQIDNFLVFMKDELIPEIEANFSADPTDRTIFGHSTGGDVSLYAMFQEDQLFQRFIAGSFSDTSTDLESKYAEIHDDLPAILYLTAGSTENRPWVPDLFDSLVSRQYPSLKIDMEILEGEGHVTVIPGTILNGLRSVFGK